MKACWGRRGIVPLIVYLVTALDGGEWSTSRPGRFTPGKETHYRLNMRLGGLQSQCGHSKEKKNLLPLPGFGLQTIYRVI